jgi:glycosyltransferase involved in cell wall biosynthesis
MSKILLFANTDWYLYNFRLALAKELRHQKHEIVLLSPPGDFQTRLQAQGFTWLPFPLSRQGTNPLSEFGTLLRLFRIYQQVQPNLVHHFTVKPVIYGSLAAHLLRVPAIVNSITGLGHLFIDRSLSTRLLRTLAKGLYRLSLQNTQVIFENPEDCQTFIQNKFIQPEQSHLILGTGVDVEKFQPASKTKSTPLVLFSSRLLATKGLIEFVDAAELLLQKGLKARFAVAGTPDPGNPASIPSSQLDSWKQTSRVEWWGWQDDMTTALAQADIFCLPSYREGIPNALLEACASGLPIVTTDVPGCRDVVKHSVNGLLVPPRNAQALADALETLLNAPALRSTMGQAGRKIAVEQFSSAQIIAQNIEVYARASNSHS